MLKRFSLLFMILVGNAHASSLTTEQRLARLENQLEFVTQMNQEVSQVQDTVLQLNGDIEVLKKSLESLQAENKDLKAQLAEKSTPDTAKKDSNVLTAEPSEKALPKVAVTEVSAPDNAEQAAYQAAYDLVTEREYDQAIQQFDAFIKAYPDSTFLSGAHYWLGEMYSVSGKPEEAIAEFQWVLHARQDTLYAPEAAFKLGMIYTVTGDQDNAKKMFNKLIAEYPKTKAASNAKVKLRSLT